MSNLLKIEISNFTKRCPYLHYQCGYRQ